MKKILVIAACLAALGSPASAMSYFSSPAATTAAQNAASLATSFFCVIDVGASVAADVENAINAGKAKVVVRTGTTTTLQVASATLCTDLKGIPLEKAPTPLAPATGQ